jgi:hypothetical protein
LSVANPQLGVMFTGKTRRWSILKVLHSYKLWTYAPTDWWKGLPGENALSYFVPLSNTNKKCFTILTACLNVTKQFLFIVIDEGPKQATAFVLGKFFQASLRLRGWQALLVDS